MRFGKVLHYGPEVLCSYLKLVSSLDEIFDSCGSSHPDCAGVIHENGIGFAREPPIRSDLSPA
jgi:hypothetical protein